MGPDHDILVVLGFDEVVDRGAEGASDRAQLVEADPTVAGLDPAQRRGAEIAASGEVVERPATCDPQAADALSDQDVEVIVLRHTQESMRFPQGAARLKP